MNERLEQALSGHPGNHLMPFFWQQGASEETLRDYMEQMDRCGIGAVCLCGVPPTPRFCWAPLVARYGHHHGGS